MLTINRMLFWYLTKTLNYDNFCDQSCFYLTFKANIITECEQVCINKDIVPRYARFSTVISKRSATKIYHCNGEQTKLSYSSFVSGFIFNLPASKYEIHYAKIKLLLQINFLFSGSTSCCVHHFRFGS